MLNTYLPQSSTHHSKKPISHSALIGGRSLIMNCINLKQYHWRVICPIYLFHPRMISPSWMNSSTPLNSWGLGPKVGNAFCGAPMCADNLALVTSSREVHQQMLDIVSRYAFKWRHQLNSTKSVILMGRGAGGGHRGLHRPVCIFLY